MFKNKREMALETWDDRCSKMWCEVKIIHSLLNFLKRQICTTAPPHFFAKFSKEKD